MKILAHAQKTGVLQLSIPLQTIPYEIYNINTIRLSDRGFYENQDIIKVFMKGCNIQNVTEELNNIETL